MKITIKTKDTDISMPVPLAMADMAIRTVPDKVFRKAAELNEPVVIHVMTRKGEGFRPAEEKPEQFRHLPILPEPFAVFIIVCNTESATVYHHPDGPSLPSSDTAPERC